MKRPPEVISSMSVSMNSTLASYVFLLAWLVLLVSAQGDPRLEGTWTTKSGKVITGPGFYDPVNDKFFEPDLTGISYSFTADGRYEEAFYRAVANPTTPTCPSGIIQWQHGSYTMNSNGSLTLFPIAVDGRQLRSDPCSFDTSLYTRYHQFELFKSYQILRDEYRGAQRLNLFRFDGSPMNPMYLTYKPPQMLPTQTLNPTVAATASGASATAQSSGKVRRSQHQDSPKMPLWDRSLQSAVSVSKSIPVEADQLWWIGIALTSIGSIMYYVL